MNVVLFSMLCSSPTSPFFKLVLDIIMHKFSLGCTSKEHCGQMNVGLLWTYEVHIQSTSAHTHKQHGTTKISFAAVANERFGAQYYSRRLIRFCLVCSFGSVSLVAVANWRFWSSMLLAQMNQNFSGNAHSDQFPCLYQFMVPFSWPRILNNKLTQWPFSS